MAERDVLNRPVGRAVGEPATVVGVTILVMVECVCGSPQPIMLVQAQKAMCEPCGRIFSVDRVSWDKRKSTPHVELTSSLSRAEQMVATSTH